MCARGAPCVWTVSYTHLGERITEKGLGNGISLLIFAGIISNLFTGFTTLFRNAFQATSLAPWLTLLAVLLVALVMIVLVTFVDMGVRRINVHFAKRVSGRKMYGGQNSVIPMKVVSVGVLPLIFAYSFMAFPGTIIQLVLSLIHILLPASTSRCKTSISFCTSAM